MRRMQDRDGDTWTEQPGGRYKQTACQDPRDTPGAAVSDLETLRGLYGPLAVVPAEFDALSDRVTALEVAVRKLTTTEDVQRVAVGDRVRVDFAAHLPEDTGKIGTVAEVGLSIELGMGEKRQVHPYEVSLDDGGLILVAKLTPIADEDPAPQSIEAHAQAISAAIAAAARDGFHLDDACGMWVTSMELNRVTQTGHPDDRGCVRVDLPTTPKAV